MKYAEFKIVNDMPLYKCNRCGKDEWQWCTNETPMIYAFHGEPVSCDDSDEAMEEIERETKDGKR